jgi:hypothetical protein
VGGISFGAGLLVLGLGTDDYIGFDLRDRTDPSAELIERVEREGRQHHALSARTLPFRRHRACDLFVKLQDRFELSSPTATPPSCTDDSIPFFCCCWPMHAATYRSLLCSWCRHLESTSSVSIRVLINISSFQSGLGSVQPNHALHCFCVLCARVDLHSIRADRSSYNNELAICNAPTSRARKKKGEAFIM